MNSPNKLLFKVVVVCLIALAFALGITSVAHAGTDWQSPCIANYGSWTGPNAYTGTCFYAAGTIVADSNCGGGINYEQYFLAGTPNGDQCIIFVAPPPTAQDNCVAADGVWSGADTDNGTCSYAAGISAAVAACGSGYEYSETFVSGSSTGTQCTYVGTTSGGGSSSDDGETKGESAKPVTLNLGSGHNGSATFPPGSCPQKCTISSGLPLGAKDILPSDALATMYVRVVDEGGNPGTGTYTVCFKNPDHDPVTIYRLISGAWVAMAANSGSPICTTASGDGVFYLGG